MSDTNQTIINKVEVDDNEINDLLSMPGSESVLLPEDQQKPGFFSKPKVDLSFISSKSKPATPKVEKPAETTETIETIVKPTSEETTQAINDIINEPVTTETEPGKSTGRPVTVKDGTVELVKKLIESKVIVPFEDDKKIEDYTISDFQELFEANLKDKEEQLRQQVPVDFYESLPEEMQYAAKYIADGGKDLKGLFKALAQAEDTKTLSVDEPKDQESIVRQYLSATKFGTAEEIEDQVVEWKDLNKLDEKAEKFKPKLENLRSEIIASQLAQQESLKKQRQQAAYTYQNSVYETLKSGELNTLKLDKKTQGMLYNGLIQGNYPSISGNQTNLLGHLLEKYQFVEPNHSLIAEVLWHLSDPDGFKAKLKEAGKTDATEKTVRMLKTEQTNRIQTSPVIEKDETTQRKIPRTGNFFKR